MGFFCKFFIAKLICQFKIIFVLTIFRLMIRFIFAIFLPFTSLHSSIHEIIFHDQQTLYDSQSLHVLFVKYCRRLWMHPMVVMRDGSHRVEEKTLKVWQHASMEKNSIEFYWFFTHSDIKSLLLSHGLEKKLNF